MIDLSGRIALVTGGSRGIGRATALALAKAGADVVVTYLNSRRNAEEVGAEVLGLGRRTLVVRADMSETEDVAGLVDLVREQFGRLDVVVANAAGGGFRSLMDVTAENLDYAMRLNVRSFMLLLQHARDLLERKDSGMTRSKVVTVSSFGATRALPMYGAIGACKAALESMTRHAALELGPLGVNVNCVRAGVVDTGSLRALPGVEAILEERRQRSLSRGENVSPEDVARTILFLASDLSDMIQGQTIIVDAGASLHA